MPTPDMQLFQQIQQYVPTDAGVRDCWGFLTEGVKLGWIDLDALQELTERLEQHEHLGVEELLFEEIGDNLRVSFLDDYAECGPDVMIQELKAFLKDAMTSR
jgi:hypothetical protein